jgi:hypothetical protein
LVSVHPVRMTDDAIIDAIIAMRDRFGTEFTKRFMSLFFITLSSDERCSVGRSDRSWFVHSSAHGDRNIYTSKWPELARLVVGNIHRVDPKFVN